jgi:uncharacterized repeat protein (TIGR01451 family)
MFWDVIPADMDLVSYAPGLPRCQQAGDQVTCVVRDPNSQETLTFTVVITGYGNQAMALDLDPLQPGWPICTVLTETSYLRVLICELGSLKPGERSTVEVTLEAIGVMERGTQNVASVALAGPDGYTATTSITSEIEVEVRSDLEVKREPTALVVDGDTVSYTLLVTNLGPSDADDVLLTERVGPGVEIISVRAGPGDVCTLEEGGRGADCALNRVVGGEVVRVEVTVLIDRGAAGDASGLWHRSVVSGGAADPNSDNSMLEESLPGRDGE